MKKILFYYPHINTIGGVEVAILNLISILKKDYDITVGYSDNNSSFDMLLKISEHATVINVLYIRKYYDVVILCSPYCNKNYAKANKYIRWLHGCIKDMNYTLPKEEIDTYIAVGKTCKEQLDQQIKHKNKESILIYNELNKDIIELSKESLQDKKNNNLHLVTVSRISPEKGFERMLMLSNMLNEKGIDYTWDIIGEGYNKQYQAKIIKQAPKQWKFHGKKDNPFPYIKRADFLLQLSDYEAFGYVLLEALTIGTTVITTNYSSASEMINESKGYIINKDMTDIDLDMFKNKKKFKHNHTTSVDKWKKILN